MARCVTARGCSAVSEFGFLSQALSDPECGGAKAVVNAENLRHNDQEDHKLDTVAAAYEYLVRSYSQPTKSIIAKKGIGITRRFIFFVPATGPEAVNRNALRKCKTLEGSAPLRQFTDVGRPGVIQIRLRSCHQQCCIGLDTTGCVSENICGSSSLVTLSPLSEPEKAYGKHAICQMGAEKAESAIEGDLLLVEQEHESETMVAGVVTATPDGECGAYSVTQDMIETGTGFGLMNAGDRVIHIRKFEPLCLGSGLFELTAKCFPVFVEDVRIRIHAKDRTRFTEQPRSLDRRPSLFKQDGCLIEGGFKTNTIYKMSPDLKEEFLLLVPRDAAAIMRTLARGVGDDDEGGTQDETDAGDHDQTQRSGAGVVAADNGPPPETETTRARGAALGPAVPPAAYRIVDLAAVPTEPRELGRKLILFKWNGQSPIYAPFSSAHRLVMSSSAARPRIASCNTQRPRPTVS